MTLVFSSYQNNSLQQHINLNDNITINWIPNHHPFIVISGLSTDLKFALILLLSIIIALGNDRLRLLSMTFSSCQVQRMNFDGTVGLAFSLLIVGPWMTIISSMPLVLAHLFLFRFIKDFRYLFDFI